MAKYWYQLAPFVRRNDGGMNYWGWPDGAVGVLDFGTIPAMREIATTERPLGFFWSLAPISGATLLAQGDCRELNTTATMQDKWEVELGFRPQGDKLADLIADQFTRGSDPRGDTACRPLIPGLGTGLEVHMPGHSRVWHQPFDLGHLHSGKVLDVLRADFRQVFEDAQAGRLITRHGKGDREHHRRVLDAMCRKYGTDDWQQFVPPDLRKHIPGRLPRETTITENFNTADSDTLGPTLTWTELEGDIDIVTNRAQIVTYTAAQAVARADSDLSSVDHYSQVAVTNITAMNSGVGVIHRKDGTATLTYYHHDFISVDTWRSFRREAGTYNAILSNSAVTLAANDIIKGDANGTTITRYKNGVAQVSGTDTAIPTGVRCGIHGTGGGGAGDHMDNFEAGDLAAAAFNWPSQIQRVRQRNFVSAF